jgi:hypothetical protein
VCALTNHLGQDTAETVKDDRTLPTINCSRLQVEQKEEGEVWWRQQHEV